MVNNNFCMLEKQFVWNIMTNIRRLLIFENILYGNVIYLFSRKIYSLSYHEDYKFCFRLAENCFFEVESYFWYKIIFQ